MIKKPIQSIILIIAISASLTQGISIYPVKENNPTPINVMNYSYFAENLIPGTAHKISINNTHIAYTDGSTWAWLYDIKLNLVNGLPGTGIECFEYNGTHYFMCNNTAQQITVYNSSFHQIASIGLGGSSSADGSFNRPSDIVFNDTHTFVLDKLNNRVQIFDEDLNYKSKFGSYGNGLEQFNSPQGMMANGTHIFIADTSNDRIQIYDFNGNQLDSLGSLGIEQGELNSPFDLTFFNNQIIVADTGNDRIQIYDASGNYMYMIGNVGTVNGPGGSITNIGFFDNPTDVAANDTHIFVGSSRGIEMIHFKEMHQVETETNFITSTKIVTETSISTKNEPKNNTVTIVSTIENTSNAGDQLMFIYFLPLIGIIYLRRSMRKQDNLL